MKPIKDYQVAKPLLKMQSFEEYNPFYVSLLKGEQKLAFAVFSYQGHLKWLEECLISYRATKLPVALFYDPSRDIYPPAKVLKQTDMCVIIPKFVKVEKTTGRKYTWFWQAEFALELLEGLGFETIFIIMGDCKIEKPKNLPQLLEHMNECDFLAYHGSVNRKYGTMAMIIKLKALRVLFDYITEGNTHIPFGRDPAVWMGVGVVNLGLVGLLLDDPKFRTDYNLRTDDKGKFAEILGLRHLQKEPR